MTDKEIIEAASKLERNYDLLVLLNKIKKDELGDRAHPFKMDQLNFFINPKRNRFRYKTFTIPKKSGGVRTISAPVRLLKSFLTYTNILLQAFYDAPECVTGFVPAKSVVDNAERHIGMNYIFNTDLKDFFPSISKSRVWATLKTQPFNFNDTIADAIAGLCCTYVNKEGEEDNVALPQGSPCSPILTNIVCHNLDWKLSGLARRFGLNYSRYADDITFSSMHNVYQEDGEFMTELKRIISGQHFLINEKKTRLQKKGQRQEVTGLVVSDRVNVTREYVRDLDNLLYIWLKYGRAAAFAKFAGRYVPKQDLKASVYDMNRVVAGRLAYLRMVKREESPVWRRLQKRFNLVSGEKGKTPGTNIQYLNFYTIDSFVQYTGLKISFDIENDKPVAFFMKDDRRINIAMSGYIRKRIKNILLSDDKAALARFTHRHIIAYCRSIYEHFWIIIRSIPQKEKAETETIWQSAQLDSKSTDDILKNLVTSNFDLKILDQWDKTRNS